MCHSTYYRKNATKGQTKTDDGDAAKIQGRNTALSDDFYGWIYGALRDLRSWKLRLSPDRNLMDLLIDVSDGNGFSAAARIGAFLIFSSGIAAAWLLHEFCTLPMRELCIVVDAAALMLSARLPEEVFAFFRVYPLFFATSFQWGSFNHVGQYPSATLFLTENLKNCVTRWLRYFFYRDVQDLTGARIYTLTIANYLLGGSLGCAAVNIHGAAGVCWAFAPLAVAALVLWQERCAQQEAEEPSEA